MTALVGLALSAKCEANMKLTFADLEDKVCEVRYFYWDTLTVCVIEVENGYKLVGTSACADPAEYNKELGDEIAYKDAVTKLWPLEGYLLRQDIADGVALDEMELYVEEGPIDPPETDPPMNKVPFDWDEFLSPLQQK